MFEKVKIDEFKKRHRGFQVVSELKTIHPALNHKVSVGFQSVGFSEDKQSWFWVFADDEYVMNPLSFSCRIESEDIAKIAKDIISCYIERCQLEEIENESKGIVPCEEMKGIRTSCDDCPQLTSKGGDCIGAMWNHPNLLYLSDVEKKWKDKYGKGSLKEQEHCHSEMISGMNQYLHRCGNRPDMLIDLLNYMTNHVRFDSNELKKGLQDVLSDIHNKNQGGLEDRILSEIY